MKTTNRVYAFDCDDVLASSKHIFAKGIEQIIREPVDPNTWTQYSLTKLYPTLKWDDFTKWIVEEDIFCKLPCDPYAKTILDEIRAQGSEIVIITARGFHPDAEKQTRVWVEKNNLPVDKIFITNNKYCKTKVLKTLNTVEYFIDDNDQYFVKAQKLRNVKNVFLRDQPWNKHIETQNRIHSLSELFCKFDAH